jgi:glycosyltransferase involved in cell wall biosynthesis
MPKDPLIHIALPAMNERNYIEKTLECIARQSIRGFHIWVCVNQPDNFHQKPDKKHICHNNAQTLELLRNYPLKNLHIIDCTSPGKGWKEGKTGVGYARKTVMDAIAAAADDNDIILSMDADTIFNDGYLESVKQIFLNNPDALALANPYYHPLGPDDTINRAMLRYEIYMRYYALNMRFAGTPYCFSPLGSAMAATIRAYKKINGLTPKKSGEDFYFLQKLVKAGRVIMHNSEVVYPGNRLSDRVFFGTGPAMIKGIAEGWAAYPLFNLKLFEKVKQTIDLFPKLFYGPTPTPMDEFIKIQFGEEDVFAPLRQNHKIPSRFVKACHEKIDGLRILQFLKAGHSLSRDEDNLNDFFQRYFPDKITENNLDNLDFSLTNTESINILRNFLFETELNLQKNDAEKTRQAR